MNTQSILKIAGAKPLAVAGRPVPHRTQKTGTIQSQTVAVQTAKKVEINAGQEDLGLGIGLLKGVFG